MRILLQTRQAMIRRRNTRRLIWAFIASALVWFRIVLHYRIYLLLRSYIVSKVPPQNLRVVSSS